MQWMTMLYFALALLLAFASLMIDIAAAWGNAVKAKQTGAVPGGVSILPGLLFFPTAGCALAWCTEKVFPGYAIWIIGIPVLLVILLAIGYCFRCRRLVLGRPESDRID